MYLVKAIPDKLFFKIGEVCELIEVQPHVLRYWESEFPQLAPQKNRSGQRTYRRTDVDVVVRIKQLLYEEGFTIAGAKKKLASEIRGATKLKVVAASVEPTPENKVEIENKVEVKEPTENNVVSVVPSAQINLHQRKALRQIKQELQALLTMLSHGAIIRPEK
jgi:DNA-binding transcriptional MerR regulator